MIKATYRKLLRLKQPLVTVVVANYNNSKYLIECVDSILSQSYKNLQIVICDDYSTDNSRKILSSYSKKYKKIKVILNEKNLGVSRARDKAIQHADGDYITTLDSDDYLISNEKISTEISCSLRYKQNFNEDVIAFSNVIVVNKNGDYLGKYQNNNIKEGELFNDILSRNCMIPRDFLFTKEMYYSVGGFDLTRNLYEDWELKIKLAMKYRFYYSGVNGIAYRRKGYGLSYQSKEKHYANLLEVFNAYIHNVEDEDSKRQVFMRFNEFIKQFIQ